MPENFSEIAIRAFFIFIERKIHFNSNHNHSYYEPGLIVRGGHFTRTYKVVKVRKMAQKPSKCRKVLREEGYMAGECTGLH